MLTCVNKMTKLMNTIPQQLTKTMLQMYKDKGEAWLNSLPHHISECEQQWNITVLPPFAQLSYNYVAPALRTDGSPVVLKIGVPNRELLTEIKALELYQGNGIVKLLASDYEKGTLLLERLSPGTPLAAFVETDDATATTIAAQVMRQLWQPVPSEHIFPSVAIWASGLQNVRKHYDGTTGPLPVKLVEEAETLFEELLSSMGEQVLLHGDLHHFNILAAERQPWMAIDPKGVVGEAVYEVGALLRNPMPQILALPNPSKILEHRICLLSEILQFDRKRIRAWAVAQAVLSAWWNIEDQGTGWENSIECASILSELNI